MGNERHCAYKTPRRGNHVGLGGNRLVPKSHRRINPISLSTGVSNDHRVNPRDGQRDLTRETKRYANWRSLTSILP